MTEVLLDASEEHSLQVNTVKLKHIVTCLVECRRCYDTES
jgi:hypothetical protein